MYLKEIDFYSTKYSKGIIYKVLIGKYINLLSNDENIKKLQDIKKIEVLLNNTLGYMAQFALNEDLTIETLNEGIQFLKAQYLENEIIEILEALCMGLCKKIEISKDITIINADIDFALLEAHLHKKESATLYIQIIRLYCILGEFDLAINELIVFPIYEALKRKTFFENNIEINKLRFHQEFQNWYLTTFNETHPTLNNLE